VCEVGRSRRMRKWTVSQELARSVARSGPRGRRRQQGAGDARGYRVGRLQRVDVRVRWLAAVSWVGGGWGMGWQVEEQSDKFGLSPAAPPPSPGVAVAVPSIMAKAVANYDDGRFSVAEVDCVASVGTEYQSPVLSADELTIEAQT